MTDVVNCLRNSLFFALILEIYFHIDILVVILSYDKFINKLYSQSYRHGKITEISIYERIYSLHVSFCNNFKCILSENNYFMYNLPVN